MSVRLQFDSPELTSQFCQLDVLTLTALDAFFFFLLT